MTIIQPSTHTPRINLALLFVVILIVAGAVGGIFTYNQTVNLRHLIQATEADIEELEAKNADYRSELYNLLDAEHLSQTGLEMGFVKDTRPQYLEITLGDLAAEL